MIFKKVTKIQNTTKTIIVIWYLGNLLMYLPKPFSKPSKYNGIHKSGKWYSNMTF